MNSILRTLIVVFLSVAASVANAQFVLQTPDPTTTTGNQAYNGVGVRFSVNSTITVFDLGIFDSGQNGIAASSSTPLSAYLFTGGGSVIAFSTFDSGSQGDPDGKYRFKNIAPVDLLPGTYVLAGFGWTDSDPEHNSFLGGNPEVFNNGGGLLTYIDSPFGTGPGNVDVAGQMPTNTFGTTNFFSAANMHYVAAIPEPEIYAMMLAGLGLMGFVARRRKQAAGA